MKKSILLRRNANRKHWVGDGFFVSTMIHPTPELYPHTSPFVLLDYAEPKHFAPREQPYGIGEHPHRGFETVTFAYQGEVSHRDSGGGGGTIEQGDVQWMTAGSGVVHEEFFSKNFTQKGGMMEMVQLWVNLPKKDKMTFPQYQGAKDESFPRVNVGEAAVARLIAGTFQNQKGPCTTFSPIKVFDLTIKEKSVVSFDLEEQTNTLILVLRGKGRIFEEEVLEKELLVLSQEGRTIEVSSDHEMKLLVLNGQPIDEPIAAHGPFVMNTQEEIMQAIDDFTQGKMGRLS
ncbi:MAG: pirin family protein [Bdellovibrionales bacterium]|nr:pirin family protein [Bdellovibrionales bacterium]